MEQHYGYNMQQLIFHWTLYSNRAIDWDVFMQFISGWIDIAWKTIPDVPFMRNNTYSLHAAGLTLSFVPRCWPLVAFLCLSVWFCVTLHVFTHYTGPWHACMHAPRVSVCSGITIARFTVAWCHGGLARRWGLWHRFRSRPWAFLGGVWMFSLCLCGFQLVSPQYKSIQYGGTVYSELLTRWIMLPTCAEHATPPRHVTWDGLRRETLQR